MEILVGFWFWLVVIVIGIGIIYEIEQDNGFATTAVAVFGAVALWYFSGGHNPFPWLANNWAVIVTCIVAYIVIGAGWGVAKWWFYLHNKADQYESNRSMYQSNWSAMNPDAQKNYTDYKGYIQSKGYPPSIAEHKADYLMWMTWWPFSATWTLLNDPIKRIGRIIYAKLAGMMGRMSAAVFAGRFTELK